MSIDGTVDSFQKILPGSQGTSGFTSIAESSASIGNSIDTLGDLDGDNVPDVVWGSAGHGGAGALFVVFLNVDGTVKSHTILETGIGGFTGAIDQNDDFRQVAALSDIDGDLIPEILGGAAHGNDTGSSSGQVHVMFLNADGTCKSQQKISGATGGFTSSISTEDRFGGSLVNLGDLNGDSVTDIAVGAKFDDDAGSNRGCVYVICLTPTGTVLSHQKVSGLAGGFTAVLADDYAFGATLGGTGDLNGSVYIYIYIYIYLRLYGIVFILFRIYVHRRRLCRYSGVH